VNLYSLALADVCPCNVPFMMRRLNKGKSTSGKQGSESVFRLRQDGWTMDQGPWTQEASLPQEASKTRKKAQGDGG